MSFLRVNENYALQGAPNKFRDSGLKFSKAPIAKLHKSTDWVVGTEFGQPQFEDEVAEIMHCPFVVMEDGVPGISVEFSPKLVKVKSHDPFCGGPKLHTPSISTDPLWHPSLGKGAIQSDSIAGVKSQHPSSDDGSEGRFKVIF